MLFEEALLESGCPSGEMRKERPPPNERDDLGLGLMQQVMCSRVPLVLHSE